MSLKFDKCEVIVDNKKIIADSASLSEETSTQPAYVIGHKNIIDQPPVGGLRNSLQLNYLMETNNEPNYYIISGLKESNGSDSPVVISIGGITGSYYLDGYNFSITPNNLVKVNASYISYENLTGNFSEQSSSVGYNLLNNSGLAHYWTTTAISNPDLTSTGSVISFNYNFKPNWEPIYAIGKPSPLQVSLINAQENFDIATETLTHIPFSGKTPTSFFNDFNSFKLKNISTLWGDTENSLTFDLESGIVTSNKVEITQDNVILVNTTVNKYY